VPEWRARLSEVAACYPKWKPLVDHWDEVSALYEEEVASGWAPKTYNRMLELRGDPYRVPLERTKPRTRRKSVRA
jgi:hypothetical protein